MGTQELGSLMVGLGQLVIGLGQLMMLIGAARTTFKLARESGKSGSWAIAYTIVIALLTAFTYGVLLLIGLHLFFPESNFNVGLVINLGVFWGLLTGCGFAVRLAKSGKFWK